MAKNFPDENKFWVEKNVGQKEIAGGRKMQLKKMCWSKKDLAKKEIATKNWAKYLLL